MKRRRWPIDAPTMRRAVLEREWLVRVFAERRWLERVVPWALARWQAVKF